MSNDEKNLYEAGMTVRQEMFGDMGVERVNNARPFNRPFEDLVTTFCFGDVWNRPGLSRRDRSLVTLAALTALTKPNQLKANIQGALANGVSVAEVREVIMHTSIYSGIPTGVEGMTAAMDILDALGVDQ